MTLDEVVKAQPSWTKRYGSSAAGAAQFMRDTLDKPGTLADLRGELGLTGREKFTGDLQDWLAFHLLKRRGYERVMEGKLTRTAFGKALAQEWASFPVLADTKSANRTVRRGQTYYSGDRVNKSLVAAETVEAVLDRVKAAARKTTPATKPAPKAAPAEIDKETVARVQQQLVAVGHRGNTADNVELERVRDRVVFALSLGRALWSVGKALLSAAAGAAAAW
ncbi:hypothetical protein SAMN04488498_1396 [Mesorhizobium albiziae]|uniref:Uncharacterized protein n=1 Tax=Neomesorhizobium albiziae TaxID=335020 RepID=A0A1I4FCH2_9HYPH|nr:glycoside hydrolase family 104 protein [Mesorhizobium albiziae]GLS30725.1 hypothetical protein GCM10007937_24330 [Mesorhizobium albiziae]SFL14091.1 hypothetical protein SAMN04488498_1396 [Mesorhizobium albiziae]